MWISNTMRRDRIARSAKPSIALVALFITAVADAQSLLVVSSGTDSIKEYAWPSGAYLGDFVAPGSGGLSGPIGLTFGPDGDLLVTSSNTSSVLRYDGTTGAFEGAFVPSLSGGLAVPWAIARRADGDVLVSPSIFGASASESVKRYDDATGAYMGDWVTLPTLGGGTSVAWGMAVAPSGNVFVAWQTNIPNGTHIVRQYTPAAGVVTTCIGSTMSGPFRGVAIRPSDGRIFVSVWVGDSIAQFDPATCAFLGYFVGTGLPGGGAGFGGLDEPESLVFGPNGNLFVCANTGFPSTSRVLEYDGATGTFVGAFVAPGSGGLSGAMGLLFRPAPPCPADFTGDGLVDGNDLVIVLGAWGACPAPCAADLDDDGDVDGTDLAVVLGAWGPCP